jgi:hypothetical protein
VKYKQTKWVRGLTELCTVFSHNEYIKAFQKKFFKNLQSGKAKKDQAQMLLTIILATQEIEIRKIIVQGQLQQKV